MYYLIGIILFLSFLLWVWFLMAHIKSHIFLWFVLCFKQEVENSLINWDQNFSNPYSFYSDCKIQFLLSLLVVRERKTNFHFLVILFPPEIYLVYSEYKSIMKCNNMPCRNHLHPEQFIAHRINIIFIYDISIPEIVKYYGKGLIKLWNVILTNKYLC